MSQPSPQASSSAFSPAAQRRGSAPFSRILTLGCLAALVGGLGCQGNLGGSQDSDPSGPLDELLGDQGNGGSGSGPKEVVDLPGGLRLEGSPGYYRVVRLTHAQWENSIKDIFALAQETGLSSGFVPDPPNGTFSNNEHALYVTDSLALDYQRSAEAVAELVSADAALLSALGADLGAASFIQTVGKRAFRRALSPEEVAQFEVLWNAGATFYASGNATADGARVVIEGLLQSPNFVYRVERSDHGTRLSGVELATKISYLLRGTTPSDQLLALAESGGLDSPEGLSTVVSQMLEEDGARVALQNFHRELFGLDRYTSILKNPVAFPSYTEALNQVLFDADLMFFSLIYTSGQGFADILTSNAAFVETTSAGYYGLPDPGPTLTQVQLDGSRPGFLTRLGFLAYNGTLNDPDPIHRGVDINNRLLCAHLEPPPGEIPPLPDPIPGQTNRQRVAAHTEQGVCAGCHGRTINPPGFSLENFDALGQARTMDNGQVVDTTGTLGLADGDLSFSSMTDLAPQLADSQTAHSCYSAHIAEYVFARDIGAGEAELVESVQGDSRDMHASIKQMVLAVIQSPQFATARTAGQ